MVRQSGSWTFSFFHGSTRLKLAILQDHTRSFKSLQSLENSAIKRRTSQLPRTASFSMTWAGSVKTGNILKDYNFPGMLGKMHACVVSVYQALKKKRESLGTRLKESIFWISIMLPETSHILIFSFKQLVKRNTHFPII